MRIVCPSCSAAYDVPDSLLDGRKAVRCARCAREWQPAEAASAAPPRQPPPEIAASPRPRGIETRSAERLAITFGDRTGGALAIDRLMATPRPLGGNAALRLAWLGSILLILALLGAGYAWRMNVMMAWPPSIRLYWALGMAGEAR